LSKLEIDKGGAWIKASVTDAYGYDCWTGTSNYLAWALANQQALNDYDSPR
jgi:hypothetical protein